MEMERLTARNKRFPKEAYYPYCFRNDTCDGQGPSDKCDMCPLPYHICETLADYEDTGLTPEQIQELKERDTAKAAIITGYNRAIGCKVGECPTCGAMTRDYLEFCSECGQRIKWED